LENKNIFYFSPSEQDEKWGLSCTGAGHAKYEPGEPYPSLVHSRKYLVEVWERGRVLDEFQLIYIHEGKGHLRFMNGDKESGEALHGGTLFLVLPGVWHTYSPSSETGWEEYWVGFKGEWANHLFENGIIGGRRVVHKNLVLGRIHSEFKNLISYLNLQPQLPQSELRQRLIQLLELMNDSGESKGGKHQGLLESVRSSMEKEFRSNRSIEEYFNDGKNLTGHQCISYSHFRTLFKQRFQLSPGQFLEQLRWSEAKKLLHLGQKSIKEIAAELGFENPYYFSRFFKKHQGVSPKHFFG
jgi:AraC-like DNA-binding protein